MMSPTAEAQKTLNAQTAHNMLNAQTVIVVPTEDNIKQCWRCIYIDMGFIKGFNGILMTAEMILASIGLISVSVPKHKGCAYLYGSNYSYYEWVACTLLVFSLIWYLLFMLAIPKKTECLPWKVTSVIIYGALFLNYALASAMVALNACWQGGYQAAAIAGFICVAALIGHVVYHVKNCRDQRPEARSVYVTASSSAHDMKPTRY